MKTWIKIIPMVKQKAKLVRDLREESVYLGNSVEKKK